MRLPPISVFSEWPAPNFIDPERRGPLNIIVVAIFLPLALLVVGIRTYTRLRMSKSFGIDDWFIIASLFPTTGFAVIALLTETYFKWNRHIWDVDFSTIISGLKVVIAAEILFSLATSLTKISMLTLTYRIVGNSSSLLSKLIVGAIVLVTVQATTFIFTVLFECGAPSTYWKLSFSPQPQCITEWKIILAAGIVNVVTDLVVVLLPIPTVWRVKLPIQQQIILVLLFGVGFAMTLVGALRTYYLYKVNNDWDKTWESYPVWITGSAELYIGVICASIPATKKFFTQYGPRWLGISTTTDLTTESAQLPDCTSYPLCGNEVGVPMLDYGDDKKATEVPSRRPNSIDFAAKSMDLARPCNAHSITSEQAVERRDSRACLVQNRSSSQSITSGTPK